MSRRRRLALPPGAGGARGGRARDREKAGDCEAFGARGAHRSRAELGRAVSRTTTTSSIARPRDLERIGTGEFGAVTHVDVMICLDILGPDGFADPNSPHPPRARRRRHRGLPAPSASRRTSSSAPHRRAHAVWEQRKNRCCPTTVPRPGGCGARNRHRGVQRWLAPDAFWLRVYGERMQATANLFETRITFDASVRTQAAPTAAQTVVRRQGHPQSGCRHAAAQAQGRPRRVRRNVRSCSELLSRTGRFFALPSAPADPGGEPARGRAQAGRGQRMKALVTGATVFSDARGPRASRAGARVRAMVRLPRGWTNPVARSGVDPFPLTCAPLATRRAFEGVDVLIPPRRRSHRAGRCPVRVDVVGQRGSGGDGADRLPTRGAR